MAQRCPEAREVLLLTGLLYQHGEDHDRKAEHRHGEGDGVRGPETPDHGRERHRDDEGKHSEQQGGAQLHRTPHEHGAP